MGSSKNHKRLTKSKKERHKYLIEQVVQLEVQQTKIFNWTSCPIKIKKIHIKYISIKKSIRKVNQKGSYMAMENTLQTIQQKELLLTETKQKELREQYIDRVDVLEKVKSLIMLPDIELMTVAQVADFYEVDVDTVKRVHQRNKNEIDEDGVVNLTSKLLKGQVVPLDIINRTKAYAEVEFNDGTKLILPNRGLKGFPKRAVLRIGILLRDSKVAKEVRTQLLNTFKEAPAEAKKELIDEGDEGNDKNNSSDVVPK